MTFTKEIKDRELYVYANGKLIYKRWLDTGQSIVVNQLVYDKYTLVSIKDQSNEQS
ncbi:hypothetical protein [Winogradskyella sp.]|uniref:hypothetical protein n=1 Tax=Winogradskyella sp. TaxID=1883156 RepID=UPI003AA7D9E7